jgi:hypothetical protein
VKKKKNTKKPVVVVSSWMKFINNIVLYYKCN